MTNPQNDPIKSALGKTATRVLAPVGHVDEVTALCCKALGVKGVEDLPAKVVTAPNFGRLNLDSLVVVVTSVPTRVTRERQLKNGNSVQQEQESYALKLAGVVAVRDHFDPNAGDDVGEVKSASFFEAVQKLALPLTVKRQVDPPSFGLALA